MIRLYVLRAAYLLLAAGQAASFWPPTISHTSEWALRHGVAYSLLAGMSIFGALGVRYPLKMLPILLFEFAWKAIWVVAIYGPLWRAGRVDADTRESLVGIAGGVVVCALVIPWGYVIKQYFKQPGDPWRKNPPLRS